MVFFYMPDLKGHLFYRHVLWACCLVHPVVVCISVEIGTNESFVEQMYFTFV